MGPQAAFEIATILADESRLASGMCLSDGDVERLLLLDQPYRARARALGLLAVRDRPGAEIHSRLARFDFGEEVIAATIEWLRERGYVDDSRFIQSYAAEKRRAAWGPRRVSAELLRKGLSRQEVEAALASANEDAESERDDEEMLVEMVAKKFGTKLLDDPEAAERRISGFLQRRGHDWDTVRSVILKLRARDATER